MIKGEPFQSGRRLGSSRTAATREEGMMSVEKMARREPPMYLPMGGVMKGKREEVNLWMDSDSEG